MKRKLLLSLLAFAGGLTVVGSGFSAWYFGSQEQTATKSINHYITDLNSSVGTLTDLNASDNLYIVFNQGGYANKDDVTKGISITNVTGTVSDSNTGTLLETIGAKYEISANHITTLLNAGITSGTFSATLELTTKAANYIEFKSYEGYDTTTGKGTLPDASGLSLNAEKTKVTYTYKVDFNSSVDSSSVVSDYSQEFKFDASTTDGVNKMLQYKTGKKPTDANGYNDMAQALDENTLMNISYSFKINEA